MSDQKLKITDFEKIYLKEDRLSQPKENFKLILNEIQKDFKTVRSALDVGCATGEFLYFFNKNFPDLERIDGMDILPKLLEVAKTRVINGHFYLEDISKGNFFFPQRYDLVTNIGVLAYISDWKMVLRNLWGLLNPKGVAYVFSVFNEEAVDVEVRFRRYEDEGEWEFRNTPSMKSVEKYLQTCGKKYEWINFVVPFPIEKRKDDPMRSWTEPFRGNPHFLFQGNGQLTTQKILKIWEDK